MQPSQLTTNNMSNIPHEPDDDPKPPFCRHLAAPLPANFADVVDHLSDMFKSPSREPWPSPSPAEAPE